jgi:hypothetical protein
LLAEAVAEVVEVVEVVLEVIVTPTLVKLLGATLLQNQQSHYLVP